MMDVLFAGSGMRCGQEEEYERVSLRYRRMLRLFAGAGG